MSVAIKSSDGLARLLAKASIWSGRRDGHALDADELQVLLRRALDLQPEFDRFANARGDLVQVTRLQYGRLAIVELSLVAF